MNSQAAFGAGAVCAAAVAVAMSSASLHWPSFAAGCVVAVAASAVLTLLKRPGSESGSAPKLPAAFSPLSRPSGSPQPGAGMVTPPEEEVGDLWRGGTLVEFQWYVKQLQRPRGSLISPNFGFADLEWQLSIDGADAGVYLAANGRGVRARYRISVVKADLRSEIAGTERQWVSSGFEEFGEKKWGYPGVMQLFYGKDIVVTVAFAQVISPVNHVTPGGQWLVGIDSYGGHTAAAPPESRTVQTSADSSPPLHARTPPPRGSPVTYGGAPLGEVCAGAAAAGVGAAGKKRPITYRGEPLQNVVAVPLARGVEPRILVEQCSPRAAQRRSGTADALGSALPNTQLDL